LTPTLSSQLEERLAGQKRKIRDIGSGLGQKRSESLDMGKSGLSGQSASQKYEKILNKNPPSSAKALLEENQNSTESAT